MHDGAAELARLLAREAEAVCRHYLPNGRREGRYWLVGDVLNTAGRSLYVRITGATEAGLAVGKWADAATGQHGDLLDLIALNRGLSSLRDTLDEARRFLALPRRATPSDEPMRARAPTGSTESARRLFGAARPLRGTLAEAYLRQRALTDLSHCTALRFHPHCYYRPGPDDPPETPGAAPALICAVTDLAGHQTGALRTWLDAETDSKAAIASPRRAMGVLRGHGVRFGVVTQVLAAGEGVETMLSLHQAAPELPLVAALSAAHLAALALPHGLQRLYLVRDADQAGERSVAHLAQRAYDLGIEAIVLDPLLGDFNDDLRRFGVKVLRRRLSERFTGDDAERFLAA